MTPLLLLLALQDPGPSLDRASAAYQTIRTLSAEFTQVIANPLIGAPDTTRGKLYQMRPSRFAMRFTHPRGDRIVADGRHLWLYTPSTTPGQVIRTTIPATSTSGGPHLLRPFVQRPPQPDPTPFVPAGLPGRPGLGLGALISQSSVRP